MTSNDSPYEAVVKEFGNGAHITVPKDWLGDIIQLERVSSHNPPLFTDVETGKEVVVDVELIDNQHRRRGYTDTDITVTGEVTDHSITDSKKQMTATVCIDGENRLYRITVEREVGDDGWNDSEYSIEESIDVSEFEQTDEVISLTGDTAWVPLGTVTSFAVKQTT